MVLLAVMIMAIAYGVISADTGPRTEAERAFDIKETILCPVCDGQNVLESNAPIAASIRVFIDEAVAEGDTDDEIRRQLVDKYDEDINAKPPATGLGSLVWTLPVAGLIAVVGSLVFSFRRWSLAAEKNVSGADRELVAKARVDQ
ncbi:MAG: hypothetical protein GXP35_04315 [Actinobacteria bacterium]|nr:hypothetical protein [Actinomycetota bacterium]